MISDASDSDEATGAKPCFGVPWGRRLLGGRLAARAGQLARRVGLSSLTGLTVLLMGSACCRGGVAGSLDLVPAWPASSDGVHLALVSDGDSLDLMAPPQGGYVMYIGALVRSATGSSGTIRAELRRGETDSGQLLTTPGAIIVFEERSTSLVPLPAGVTPPNASPGWQQLRADFSDLANLPACPNFLPVEIPDHTLQLQVTYTDSQGNTGVAARQIVPRCTQTDVNIRNNCLCECRANYTIARCFVGTDGGPLD